jgi:hypothetical protein
MAERGTEPAETGLGGGERPDSNLTAFLEGLERLPTGAKLKLELPETPKIKYTDLRTIYPSVIPFQEAGDFKRKKKGKKGRPKEKDRILTGEEKRKLNNLNVISSRKKKIEELMKGGMSFAKSKKLVLKEK